MKLKFFHNKNEVSIIQCSPLIISNIITLQCKKFCIIGTSLVIRYYKHGIEHKYELVK